MARTPPSTPSARTAALLACLLLAAGAQAQERRLTLDDIYDPDKKVDFDGTAPTGLTWTSDTHYHWPRTDRKAKRTEHLKVEALSGKTEPLFDAAKMRSTLARIEGVSAEEADRLAHSRTLVLNEARTAALLDVSSDLYHCPFGGEAVRLTSAAGKEEEPTYSPDGRRVAFVRDNDLFVVEVATRQERRLTSDGSPDLLNGKLDWVYQEEIYGRNRHRAYWWSPDSSHLAFLQLSEKDVPRYTLVNDIPYHPEVETWPYPKAGDPNPGVKLGVVSADGGPTVWVKADRYSGTEILLVDVAWSPDSKKVWYQVQDREQTWLDVDVADASRGDMRTLFREAGKAWVDNPGSPHWLKDGSFLLFSERTGWRHVYHFKADGTLVRAVTGGRFEARTLHGVDEAAGLVYFSGTERSPVGSDVYQVGLDGTGLKRLSSAAGTHNATFNPSCRLYIDSWNDLTTPSQVRLHRRDGTEVRVIDANPMPILAQYRLARPQLLQVKTRDGFVMEALMIKPPDFDPGRKYPVYQHTYGGPHAPQVRNTWGGSGYMFHQLLAQKGIVVWILDNRTASGKGAESVWPGYQRMGELELQDVEDGISWLKQQPWVDAARIGINGWSYGGFMVTYALTHSKSFAMGIAGGPVTDWRDYDSVYTERYMRTPQKNPEGYKETAPRHAAKDLHGTLLLIHGAIDDNVHPQNTLQLAHELQKAGKPFRMMLYPKSRHGVSDPALLRHLRGMMTAFIEETLLGR